MSFYDTTTGEYIGQRREMFDTGAYYREMAYRHLATALFISFLAIGAMAYFFPIDANGVISGTAFAIYGIGSLVEMGIIFFLLISMLFGRNQFSEGTALLILNIFAVATGLTLGFMVNIALFLDPMIIVYTFGTAGITVFSIYAYTSTRKPDVSGLYKKVMIFAILFMIFGFFGIFFLAGSPLFMLLFSGIGALLFAVFMYLDFARLERNEFRSPAMMALWLFYDIIFFIKYLLMFFIHLSNR